MRRPSGVWAVEWIATDSVSELVSLPSYSDLDAARGYVAGARPKSRAPFFISAVFTGFLCKSL